MLGDHFDGGDQTGEGIRIRIKEKERMADALKQKLQKIWDKPRDKRTIIEVRILKTEGAVFGGCCERFAEMSGCDCESVAVTDNLNLRHPESYSDAAEGVVGVSFTPDSIKGHSGSKYVRRIRSCVTRKVIGEIDAYSVIDAVGPMPAARSHALKKIMYAGLRGKASAIQDIKEAIDSLKEDLKALENA